MVCAVNNVWVITTTLWPKSKAKWFISINFVFLQKKMGQKRCYNNRETLKKITYWAIFESRQFLSSLSFEARAEGLFHANGVSENDFDSNVFTYIHESLLQDGGN